MGAWCTTEGTDKLIFFMASVAKNVQFILVNDLICPLLNKFTDIVNPSHPLYARLTS